jgi:transposase
LKNISRQQFACKTDALEALHILTKKIKYHKFVAHPVEVRKHPKNGRPKKGVLGSVVGYKLQGVVEEDPSKIAISKLTKGRFILSTNQLDIKLLPTETILSEYKEQSKTESGFKFIKDNSFEVSSIFLKKPERISALMMIMTLCLMVYCIAQHALRTSLQTLDKDVLNQNGSPTQNPTMKRVFKLFHGVQVLTIVINGEVQELVINLNTQLKDILSCFSSKALEIYDLTAQTRVIKNCN